MSRFERWLQGGTGAAVGGTAPPDRLDHRDRLEPPPEPARTDPTGWRGWLWLASLLTLAVLAFELTADPALGTVILCLKLGLDDVWTARWHFRNDPEIGRARTLFWFHLARASWWVGLSAIVLAIAVVYVALFFQNRILKVRPAVERLLLEATFGVGLGILVTAVACGCALHYGVKAWVDSRPAASRRDGWPPLITHDNSARGVILLAVFFFTSIGSVALMTALRNALRLDRTLAFAIMMLTIWIATALAVRLVNALLPRVVAETPGECWAELAEPDVGAVDSSIDPDPPPAGEDDDSADST